MPDNCAPAECPYVHRIETLEKENERHTETHKEIFGRLNKVEQDNAVQEAHYKNILEKLVALTASHEILNQKLSVLEAKPGKRWEGIVDKAVWAVAAAVIAFLLARVGL